MKNALVGESTKLKMFVFESKSSKNKIAVVKQFQHDLGLRIVLFQQTHEASVTVEPFGLVGFGRAILFYRLVGLLVACGKVCAFSTRLHSFNRRRGFMSLCITKEKREKQLSALPNE